MDRICTSSIPTSHNIQDRSLTSWRTPSRAMLISTAFKCTQRSNHPASLTIPIDRAVTSCAYTWVKSRDHATCTVIGQREKPHFIHQIQFSSMQRYATFWNLQSCYQLTNYKGSPRQSEDTPFNLLLSACGVTSDIIRLSDTLSFLLLSHLSSFKLSTMGNRAFPVAVVKTWNALADNVGSVAQWFGRRSLAGGLFLTRAWSMVDRWQLCW